MSLLPVRRTLAATLMLLLATGCATTDVRAGLAAAGRPGPRAPHGPTSPANELRLGYFANVTHAGAIYGVATGAFAAALGPTTLRTQVFNAGPAAIEAIFAGSLDAAFIGPNPTVNGFVKSAGEAIRIVAGASSGGAALVVQPAITEPASLRGKRLASPQTGGTQDIALRHYLAAHGIEVDLRGAGDTTVVAQENSQTLSLFRSRDIDGAWVPEPWASRLVLEGGGKVLVDEADLWPGGRFVTTHLIVRTAFLREHPESVSALLRGLIAANRAVNADREEAKTVVNAELKELTGTALTRETIDRAFAAVTVTEDPIASSLKTSAEHAFATGLVPDANLVGIYDLRLLNELLGRTFDDAGLGAPDSAAGG